MHREVEMSRALATKAGFCEATLQTACDEVAQSCLLEIFLSQGFSRPAARAFAPEY